MQTPGLLPLRLRAAGIATCAALAAAACDDGGTFSQRDDCVTLRQTQAEIESGRAEGQARVRLNLVSRLGVESGSTEQVSLSGADLYVGDTCYRLDNVSSQSLAGLENDMGFVVADASVAPGEVTHVLLRAAGPQGGRTYSEEKVALDEVVRLQAGTRTDIYLSLDPVGTSSSAAETRVVAAGMMPWNATTMVMDPVRGGAMSMPGGFSIDMPAGSIEAATVFGFGEIKSGDVSSSYYIWPESGLSEPVQIRFPINRARIPKGLQMSDYGGRVGGVAADATVEGNTATVTADGSLGQVRMGTDQHWLETTDGQLTAMRTPTVPAGQVVGPSIVDNTCYRRLLNARAELMAMSSQNYGVRTTLCEDVEPQVHILIVNVGRAGLSTYPRIHFPSRRMSDGRFELHEISTHLSGFNDFAAINGFTWTGDKGYEWGGYGTPIGTVYMNYNRVSPWYTGAEVMIGFGPYSPQYGAPTRFFDRAPGVSLNLTGYEEWMVPGTTSIIKNGACSRTPGGDDDRWSTVGIGNGVLVMASSVSYTTTTAYDLCSVYEGLGVLSGALRLDGGSAAGISWLGNTLNPLTGSDFTALGNERHIAYVVAGLYP